MELQEAKRQANICQWRQMVYECRNSGMTVAQWCQTHQISIKAYYYRQRQVWKAESTGANDSAKIGPTVLPAPGFAEVKLPQPHTITSPASEAPAITIKQGKLVYEIRNGADPELLRQILCLVNDHV